ncbi:MAG: Mini-ribonuclease 3 [Bacillota bacterium]
MKSKFLKKVKVTKLTKDEITMMSPLKLAYLGDSVFDLYIRTYLLNKVKGKVNKINKEAIKYVNASSQGYIARNLKEFLTKEEWQTLKRGRNQKGNVPRNADVSDYRYATGLEALIGFLYLKNREERIIEIISKGIDLLNEKNKK